MRVRGIIVKYFNFITYPCFRLRNMGDSSNNSEAAGYKEASRSAQKVDGEDFIQTDVRPKAGDVILDLGCGTGELSAYLSLIHI